MKDYWREVRFMDEAALKTFTAHTGSTSWVLTAWPASSSVFSMKIKIKIRKKCYAILLILLRKLFNFLRQQMIISQFIYFFSDPHHCENDDDDQDDHQQAANSESNPHPPDEAQQHQVTSLCRWTVGATWSRRQQGLK